jgi:protein-S-isoprenylcysteine O-methyltransferase Ste14
VAWALAIVAGFVAEWLLPFGFLRASALTTWGGIAMFALGLALAVWAIVTLRRAGTRVETTKPTTAIVAGGPYRFMRNPIYGGMLMVLFGLALALHTAWLLLAMVPFYLVIRFGVIAREEAYLERKFGGAYLDYRSRVRRWLQPEQPSAFDARAAGQKHSCSRRRGEARRIAPQPS